MRKISKTSIKTFLQETDDNNLDFLESSLDETTDNLLQEAINKAYDAKRAVLAFKNAKFIANRARQSAKDAEKNESELGKDSVLDLRNFAELAEKVALNEKKIAEDAIKDARSAQQAADMAMKDSCGIKAIMP